MAQIMTRNVQLDLDQAELDAIRSAVALSVALTGDPFLTELADGIEADPNDPWARQVLEHLRAQLQGQGPTEAESRPVPVPVPTTLAVAPVAPVNPAEQEVLQFLGSHPGALQQEYEPAPPPQKAPEGDPRAAEAARLGMWGAGTKGPAK